MKHPQPQGAEGLGPKSGASPGQCSQLQHPPPDWAHDPQEAAESGGVQQAGSKDAGNAPARPPPTRACFYGNFPRSAEAATLPGDKGAPHPTGPGSLRSQGSPDPQGGSSSPGALSLAILQQAWPGGTWPLPQRPGQRPPGLGPPPRNPDQPFVPSTGLLGRLSRPHPPHGRRTSPAPGTHLGLWAGTCAHRPSVPVGPRPPASPHHLPQPQAALIRRRLLTR